MRTMKPVLIAFLQSIARQVSVSTVQRLVPDQVALIPVFNSHSERCELIPVSCSVLKRRPALPCSTRQFKYCRLQKCEALDSIPAATLCWQADAFVAPSSLPTSCTLFRNTLALGEFVRPGRLTRMIRYMCGVRSSVLDSV